MPAGPVEQLVDELSAAVERGPFSGVVVVDHRGRRVLEVAAGLADRAEGRAMTTRTRMATASMTKGFTALAVVSLVEEGLLDLGTGIRDVVGDDLPHVDPAVTVEHLLGHTSGVGDYLDEEQVSSSDDHVLDVPVHVLEGPEDYLPLLNRHHQVEPPGTRFRYNNGGYVVLALVVERVAGRPYHDEVRRRVLEPAGMAATDFLRSDRLPGGVALGYLGDGRTNVLHLPVVGTGDGGAWTTGADMVRFWGALLAGAVVAPSLVERMTTPNGAFADRAGGRGSYGLGFSIGPDGATLRLEGEDAGVSCCSGTDPRSGLTYCLMANNAHDTWPLVPIVDRHLRRPDG